jgi:hypothetical protein
MSVLRESLGPRYRCRFDGWRPRRRAYGVDLTQHRAIWFTPQEEVQFRGDEIFGQVSCLGCLAGGNQRIEIHSNPGRA